VTASYTSCVSVISEGRRDAASVTSTTPDPTTPNSATASGVASFHADLSITIADSPDPVAAGGNLTYQVVVTNDGPSDAASPSLAVVLDTALHFLSVASAPGWTCTTPVTGQSGTVACTAPLIAKAASASSFTIVTFPRVSVPPLGTAVISTSASTTSITTDPNPANNSASATTTVAGAAVIPTLSELAFVAMAAMLALVAMLKLSALRSPRT
jgi:uncharacterized repeat protein (TIGR01451 family)